MKKNTKTRKNEKKWKKDKKIQKKFESDSENLKL